MSNGEDVASVKREAKAQILDMLQTLAQVKVTEKEIKRKKKEKKVTVTRGRGRNPTHDLANGQPCSNQKKHNGI